MLVDWTEILSGTDATIQFEHETWCGNQPFSGCDILLLKFPTGQQIELQCDDDDVYVVTQYQDNWKHPSETRHADADSAIAAVKQAAMLLSKSES